MQLGINKQTNLETRLPYRGKLSREKTFPNFKVLWLFTKVFSAKFGGVVLYGSTSKQFTKVFFCNNLIFYQFAKVFSCKSFHNDWLTETFILKSPSNHSLLCLVPGKQVCIVYLGS